MRFLFVTLPLLGHLDWGGLLTTALELAQRGRAVAWSSEASVQPPVAGAGVEFLPLRASGWRAQPALPAGAPQAVRQQRALDAWLSLPLVAEAVAALHPVVREWRPDVIVAEPYAAAAAVVAEQEGCALAVVGRPALPDPVSRAPGPAAGRVAELCQMMSVHGRYWDVGRGQIRSPQLHVDFFSRRWYADLPAIAGQTRFVGGQAPTTTAPDPEQPPVVLITLGSLFNQDPVFFQTAAEAVFLEGGEPLVVTGGQEGAVDPTLLQRLPAGTDVRAWVDFSATLPRLAALIHHGGVGTTHAALRHGLPQLAVPHAGDQVSQAGRITQAKVGFGVRPADFSLANARWLVRRLLWDDDLRRTALAWRSELAALGGVQAAATALDTIPT